MFPGCVIKQNKKEPYIRKMYGSFFVDCSFLLITAFLNNQRCFSKVEPRKVLERIQLRGHSYGSFQNLFIKIVNHIVLITIDFRTCSRKDGHFKLINFTSLKKDD